MTMGRRISLRGAPTSRGFMRCTFEDDYGVACSLQKSSAADDDCVWLGCNTLDLKRFTPGSGWSPLALEGTVQGNTRMHLSREHVRALLPALQHFADTGHLVPCGACGEVWCQHCQYEIDRELVDGARQALADGEGGDG